VAKLDDGYRVLDLKEPRVRKATAEAARAKAVYESSAENDYC
jgi:hypothetical protein